MSRKYFKTLKEVFWTVFDLIKKENEVVYLDISTEALEALSFYCSHCFLKDIFSFDKVEETFGKENVNWDPNVRVKYCNNCVGKFN